MRVRFIVFVTVLLAMVIALWAPRPAEGSDTPAAIATAPPDAQRFIKEVIRRIPAGKISEYSFQSWPVDGKPTNEGFGILPAVVNGDKAIARVMDVEGYTTNLDGVTTSRPIADSRFVPPNGVHVYQLLDLPGSDVQYEIALIDAGSMNGYRLAFWYLLQPETSVLSPTVAARSQYNMGVWLISKDAVGYALSSCPRREDVNWGAWQLLTSGADVVASPIVRKNIEAMVKWASR